jgi:CRP-like cAMP-binding protein
VSLATSKPAPIRNRLLAALPGPDFERLEKAGEPIALRFDQVISEPGERIRHVYFPFDSYISLAASTDGRASLEVGLVGSEGMLGLPLLLGIATSPQRAVVRGPGSALRLTAAAFQRELADSAVLHRALNRYLYALMAQLGQTAACTRFHLLPARLARWLLMTHDRAHSDGFYLTHDFLAEMLGVRRVGITKAAGELQRDKLIRYRRGRISVLDRRGLEGRSCSCYRAMRKTYDSVLRQR